MRINPKAKIDASQIEDYRMPGKAPKFLKEVSRYTDLLAIPEKRLRVTKRRRPGG